MKKFKNKKILIISIIVVLVILIAGVVFAFVAGDLFKSNKDKFFEYGAQLFESDNGFIDERINQYFEKRSTAIYENQGTFTVSIDSENLDDETLDNINNLNISFAGNIDNVNEQAEELIKINYSDDVNFPILYKKSNGIYGIKLNEISKRYFAIEESALGELFQKLTGSTEQTNSTYTEALDSKISAAIDVAIDEINLEMNDITAKYYDDKYIKNVDGEVSLSNMIFDADFDVNSDVIVNVDENENGSTIGTITVISNEDYTYAAIGTISDTGRIEWNKKYGTYESEDLVEDEETNSNSINLNDLNLTNEEKNRIKDKCIEIFKENINDSDFTKISSSNSEGYSLELTNENLKTILVKLFEALRDDKQLLSKFNISPSNVQTIVTGLNATKVQEGKSNITVYQSDKKLNKIEILFSDAMKITISKNSDDDKVSYRISLESQTYSINLNIAYSGLKALEQVEETYELSMTMGNTGTEYSYFVENSVNFVPEDFTIKEFESDEYIDLGKLDNNKLAKVFELLIKGIQDTNAEQMKKLGIKGENPLLSIIPGVSILDSAKDVVLNADDISNTNENNGSNSTNTTTNNTNTSSSNSVVASMEQAEKETFNAKFTQYEGTTVRGATVKSLIMTIIASNMADEERQIEVTGDINLTGDEVPDSVDTSKKYKVKCFMSDEGYVNEVEILEN